MAKLTNSPNIDTLIENLASPYQTIRKRSRDSLVMMGTMAVKPLIELLEHQNYHVRWEATKALGEIGHPAAAVALVKCLEDEYLDVRWRAAEDLIAFGQAGLLPLLQALIARPRSVRLRQSALHILRALNLTILHDLTTPIVAALEGVEPAMNVPHAAHLALQALPKTGSSPIKH